MSLVSYIVHRPIKINTKHIAEELFKDMINKAGEHLPDFSGRNVETKTYTDLARQYPRATVGDLSFALYLQFGTRHSYSKYYTMIPRDIIVLLYCPEKIGMSNKIKTSDLLEQFQKNVEPLELLDYDKDHGVARGAKVNWPDSVVKIFEGEAETMANNYDIVNEKINDGSFKITADMPDDISSEIMKDMVRILYSNRVYWDGTPVAKKEAEEVLINRQKQLKKIITQNNLVRRNGDISMKMVSYLNDLPDFLFTEMMAKNFSNALRFTTARNQLDRQDLVLNISLLAHLYDWPKPMVRPTENSSRVYPFGYSLMTAPGALRRDLTVGWTELDLKHAQLAIASELWGVQSIKDILEEGKDVWRHLITELGLDYDKHTKKLVKTSIYTIVYGGSKKQLNNIFSQYNHEDLLDRFLKIDMVSDLRIRSLKQLKKIRKDKLVVNAMGQKFFLKSVKVEDGKKPERSLLAQLNQSYETKMLEPAFDLAIEQKDNPDGFYIPLYQYDGISIVAKNPDKQEYWVGEVKRVVNDRIKEMGFNTELI